MDPQFSIDIGSPQEEGFKLSVEAERVHSDLHGKKNTEGKGRRIGLSKAAFTLQGNLIQI